MSRSIEDRLVAALEARAELVTPEDLGPLEVPDRRWRPRRNAVLLLAAAATAAAVATPFVLDGGTPHESRPAGQPSVGVSESTEPEPTESPEPTPSLPSDVLVVDRQRADVDGDGRPDQVRLLLDSPTTDEPGDGFVEVFLAAGGTSVAEVPFGYPGPLKPPVDMNSDGREQVPLSHTAGGDSAQLLVYTWHEGGLLLTRTAGDAPLALDLDGKGRVNDYYAGNRGLFSWQRLDPVGPADGPMFKVEQWSWAVDGDRLVPTPAGPACVDVTSADPPHPCTGQPAG